MLTNYDTNPIIKDSSYRQINDVKFDWVNLKELHIDKLCGWSVDYQTYFILMQLLDIFKPKSILELGFGFSSLLINQYTKQFKAIYDICENDPNWIKYFLTQYGNNQKFNIIIKDIEYIKINSYNNCRIYSKFKDKLKSTYDFIFIDGPHGCDGLSRANIYQNSELLNVNSLLLIHDTNRSGEKTLVDNLLKKLSNYDFINFSKCTILKPKTININTLLAMIQKSNNI